MPLFIKNLLQNLGSLIGGFILLMLQVCFSGLFKPVPPPLRGVVSIAEVTAHNYIVKNAIAHNRRMFRLIICWLMILACGLIFWLLIWR